MHVLGAAAACEEPRFSDREDAALDGGMELSTCDGASCFQTQRPDVDGTLQPDTGAPDTQVDPRTRWEGRYAAYSQLFAAGVPPSFAEYFSLVEIKREGTGLVMEQQLCLFDGGWNALLIAGHLRFAYPAEARARSVLSYDMESFSTSAMTFYVGMTESSTCPAGAATAPASIDQARWLAGQSCECATTPQPANSKDCRVLDSDKDQQPGVTLFAPASRGNPGDQRHADHQWQHGVMPR